MRHRALIIAVVAGAMLAAGSASADHTRGIADLWITKTAVPPSVEVGEQTTFVIQVGNNGPDKATQVTMVDTLPSSLQFVSLTTTHGSCSGTSTISCSLGELEPAEVAEVRIVARTTTEGSATNTATVSGHEQDREPDNDNAVAVVRVVADRTAPDTSFTLTPTNPSGADVRFAFTSDDEQATFECSFDGSRFAVCTSPTDIDGLPEGEHSFETRAVDPAGNVDPTPARFDWSADLRPPKTIITSGPSDPSSSTSATFTFTANEPATFVCSIDGGPFVPCVSPRSYNALVDGTHHFRVRGTDTVGNVETSPAVHAWVVDTEAPNAIIDSGPPSLTNSSTAQFTFHSDDPTAQLQCSRDGSPFLPCSSPLTIGGFGEGVHTFSVRANDGANIGPAATHQWTVDTTPPATTLTGHPAATTSYAQATFSFSSNEPGSSFECRIDGGGFQPCSSPATFTVSEGGHVFRVRAIDPAGNTDPNPVGWSWTVDSSAPVLQFLQPVQGAMYMFGGEVAPAGSLPVTTIHGQLRLRARAFDTGSGIQAFEFYVNGIAVDPGLVTYHAATQVYEYAWQPPAAGSYTLEARALDNIGFMSTEIRQVYATP